MRIIIVIVISVLAMACDTTQEGDAQIIGGVCLRWLDDVVCHVRLAWIRTGAPWEALVIGPEGAYLITYEVRATHR